MDKEKIEHGNTEEPVVNCDVPQNNAFKIPKKMETQRNSQDPRRKKEEIINQVEDRGSVFNRLGKKGTGINIYNRRQPSPSPRNPYPFWHGFKNAYTPKPNHVASTNVDAQNQGQPGCSTSFYSNWNKKDYNSGQRVFTRHWNKQEYGPGLGYYENNKNQEEHSSGPGYYTEQGQNLEVKKPEYYTEGVNNFGNSRPRHVIEQETDLESTGTLVIDEQEVPMLSMKWPVGRKVLDLMWLSKKKSLI